MSATPHRTDGRRRVPVATAPQPRNQDSLNPASHLIAYFEQSFQGLSIHLPEMYLTLHSFCFQ